MRPLAPPEPASRQGEPLAWPTNRLAWCCWCDRRDIPSATAKDHWQQCSRHPANERIAALEAKLAECEGALDLSREAVQAAVDEWNAANEKLAAAERERDCGQVGVCAITPGCLRHWEERAHELVRERDEATAKLADMEARARDAERDADIAEMQLATGAGTPTP